MGYVEMAAQRRVMKTARNQQSDLGPVELKFSSPTQVI